MHLACVTGVYILALCAAQTLLLEMFKKNVRMVFAVGPTSCNSIQMLCVYVRFTQTKHDRGMLETLPMIG